MHRASPGGAVVRSALPVCLVPLTRYVLRLPPVVALGSEEIVASVGETIRRYAVGEVLEVTRQRTG